MKVLIACEFSGIVRDAFSNNGHDAWSCDLLPTESNQTIKEGKHIQGDVLDILGNGFDLMIGHPPCTYICNSGVRWLHTEKGRVHKMKLACEFFKQLLDAPIKMICIENPIPHKYAVSEIGTSYSQIIQPW